MKKRAIFLMITFSLLIFALLVRIMWVQVIHAGWYQRRAIEQQNKNREIVATRGSIYDRNGNELAVSVNNYQIIADPLTVAKNSKDLNYISQKLSQLLDIDETSVLNKLSKKSVYEVLEKRVPKGMADNVVKWKREEKISGIYIDDDVGRFYPNKKLAAHVLGFTGDDNQGLCGVEAIAEQYLRGIPGKILSEIDAEGREVPLGSEKRIEPQNGLNAVLTIDSNIQGFAQKVLENAVKKHNVRGGAMAIVMDPRNGDILALVSKPDFDPNFPRLAPPGIDKSSWTGISEKDIGILQKTVWRNKTVMDTYEPGSTFKAFTTAAGLEENVISLNTMVSDKTITVFDRKIRCWDPNAHGVETFAKGVYNSCNPVFVHVAQLLGIDKFYSYVKSFGFYEKTGIMLPGEASSIFHKNPGQVDMAVASFGQRFQVTPIQLITAYASIANGGKLIKPRIIREFTDAGGNVVKKIEPEAVRTTISSETAQLVRELLEGVVSKGTGKGAYINGYRIAGKTGTSQTTVNGRYVASFAGFAPADNPVVCALVVLDCPTGSAYYGGVIAAPAMKQLMNNVLGYMGVPKR